MMRATGGNVWRRVVVRQDDNHARATAAPPARHTVQMR